MAFSGDAQTGFILSSLGCLSQALHWGSMYKDIHNQEKERDASPEDYSDLARLF